MRPSIGPQHAAPSCDPAEFEVFYRSHVDAVMAFALSRCRSAEDAADLVASVFVRAIESAHSFDPRRGSPRAWLLGICANALTDHHRKSAREQRLLDRLKHEVPLSADDTVRLEARLDAQRRSSQVESAIRELPSGQRDILALVDRQDLSVRDAAEKLGISHPAARVRLSRARAAVRRSLSTRPDVSPSDHEGGNAR